MRNRKLSLAGWIGLVALIGASFQAAAADQVLATVAGEAIHAHELEMAVACSSSLMVLNCV